MKSLSLSFSQTLVLSSKGFEWELPQNSRTLSEFERLQQQSHWKWNIFLQPTPHVERCFTIRICIAIWKQTVKDGHRDRGRLRVWHVWCQTTFQKLTETLRLSLHHWGSCSASYHGNTGLHGGPERWWWGGETDRRKRESQRMRVRDKVCNCSQAPRGVWRQNILAQGDMRCSTHSPFSFLLSRNNTVSDEY